MAIMFYEPDLRKNGNWSDVLFFVIILALLSLFIVGVYEENKRSSLEYKEEEAKRQGFNAARISKAYEEGYNKGLE